MQGFSLFSYQLSVVKYQPPQGGTSKVRFDILKTLTLSVISGNYLTFKVENYLLYLYLCEIT